MPLVKVQTIDGGEIKVEIADDDTIENIKYKVADKIGVVPQMQKLICNNIELKDNDKVEDILEFLKKYDGIVNLVLKNSIHEEDYFYPPDGPTKRRFLSVKKKEKTSKLSARFGCCII